jgi:hypothetical protein
MSQSSQGQKEQTSKGGKAQAPYPGAAKDETDEKRREKKKNRAPSTPRKANSQRLRSREKPGAALALAKRESVAILPSKALKIKF